MAEQRSDREDRDLGEDQNLASSDRERQTDEGLIGQTGEDRNLSGSETYRTLPNQGPGSTPERRDREPGQS